MRHCGHDALGNSGRARRVRMLAAALLASTAFSAAHSIAEEPAGQPSTEGIPCAPVCEISIEKAGGPILISAQVDIAPDGDGSARCTKVFTMLLDTGAATSCFDRRHRQCLGTPVKIGDALTPLGWVSIQGFQAPAMRIGTLVVRPPARVPCVDLQWLSERIGEEVDGLLGMDVLGDLVFSIDFDEGKLRFHRAAQADFGRPVPLTLKGAPGAQRPFVIGILPRDTPIDFLIDTGGIGNVLATLAKPVFDDLLDRGIVAPIAPPPPNSMSAQVVTLTGAIDVSLARAESLSVAGYAHERAVFSAHPRVSVLGLCFLSRYFVAFDFPNSVMYLRPGKAFTRRDLWYDLTSFAVSNRDGEIFVESVREDGWGARAGVQQGDLILAINGHETRGLSLFAVRRMLAVDKRQILEIGRGGETLRIVLDMTSEIKQLLGENVGEPTVSQTARAQPIGRRAAAHRVGENGARPGRSRCARRPNR